MEGPDDRPYYLTPNDVAEWLQEHYKLGKQGFMAKSSIYNDYLELCEQRGAKPIISPTFFGKLVKRAFPGIQSVRKGPRGQVRQCYARLKKKRHPGPEATTAAGPSTATVPVGSHLPPHHPHQPHHHQLPPLDAPQATHLQMPSHAVAFNQPYYPYAANMPPQHQQQQLPHLSAHYAPQQFAPQHPGANLYPHHHPQHQHQQQHHQNQQPQQQHQHQLQQPQFSISHHHQQQQLSYGGDQLQQHMVQQHLLSLTRGRIKDEKQQSSYAATLITRRRSSDEEENERERQDSGEGSYDSPTEAAPAAPALYGSGSHLLHSVASAPVADGYTGGGNTPREAAREESLPSALDVPTANSSPLLSSVSSPAYSILPPLQASSPYGAMPNPSFGAFPQHTLFYSAFPGSSSSSSSMASSSAMGNFPHLPTSSSASAHPPTPSYHLLDNSSSPNLHTPPCSLPPPSPLLPPHMPTSSVTGYLHQPTHYYRPTPPSTAEQQYTHTSSPPTSASSPSIHGTPPAILHPPLPHAGSSRYPLLSPVLPHERE